MFYILYVITVYSCGNEEKNLNLYKEEDFEC